MLVSVKQDKLFWYSGKFTPDDKIVSAIWINFKGEIGLNEV